MRHEREIRVRRLARNGKIVLIFAFMKRMLFSLALLSAFMLLPAGCILQDPVTPGASPLGVGDSLPAFAVTTTDGKLISTSDLLGKASIVSNISVGCPDCAAQLPHMNRFFADYGDAVNVLCIARRDDAGTVRRYWADNAYALPVAAPGDASVYDLFDRGSGTGVPQTYFADSKGRIVFTAKDTHILSYEEICDVALSITD